jgi:PAS domain S-box-containing protein
MPIMQPPLGSEPPAEVDPWDEPVGTSQVFSAFPVAFAVVDSELRVRSVNPAMMEIIGLSDEEMVGQSARDLLPGLEQQAWEAIRRVLTTGEPVLDMEVRGMTPASEPEPRVWRVSHFPLLGRDGSTVAVGVSAIDVSQQRDIEAERDAVERRLRLLGRASGVIGATLDLSATLEGLVELVVPEFADNCELMLADETLDVDARPDRLKLRRTVVANTASLPPAPPGLLRSGAMFDLGPENPAHLALATRQPILFEVNEEVKRSVGAPLDKYLDYIQVTSAITVPVLVGRQYYGALYFGVGPSGRSYTDRDVVTAGELGSRIASAVANARAYARQRAAAIALQHGLLPGDVPAVEGLEIVWRYEPGTAGTEVGGDWFDVIPLSAGRVALVVGDVMGRGLTAAAVMGQVRSAVRAFAALDLPAAEVLTHLDNLVHTIGTGPDDTLVSCLYAIFEPATGTITVANAGHLPPALQDPDGTVRLLDDPSGIILGTGGHAYTETSHPISAGATFVLFTDGLVESPTVDIDEGTQRLRDILCHREGLDTTADRLLTLIDRTGGYDDDAALLLVHATVATTERTRSLTIDPEPRAARAARALAVTALRDWALPHVADITELLVSEIVTNAIRYASTHSRLTVRCGEGALYVEVSDHDSRVPRLLHPTADDEGGRGLQLVSELASSWGARPTSTGKTVWFQLDTSTS